MTTGKFWGEAMNILVSGSGGLIGSALVAFLTDKGHFVRCLKRQSGCGSRQNDAELQSAGKDRGAVHWNPVTGESDPDAFEGYDAVINLAGENISTDRWSAEKKARIRMSRVDVTSRLCQKLLFLKSPPEIFVCASAVGFYGNRGDEILEEKSACGSGFLAQVCRDLEEAANIVSGGGARVVLLRIGVVLSPKGGALDKMLFPFQMGAGGQLGSGRQYLSWISIDDIVNVIAHVLVTDSLSGPVNAVAPHPVTNHEFTRVLGRLLRRPTILAMPAVIVKAMFGEMADELLLSSARVSSTKLLESGYEFKYPELELALRHVLDGR